MTTSTIIPYRAGKQWRPADGPTICSRCSVGLLHRTSDRVEDTVDPQTNAELIVHIWEHDVDSEGRALCPTCSEADDQTEAWKQLVTWCHRSDARQLHVRSTGVWAEENGEHVCAFVAIRGLLTVPDVLAFVGRDPLRPGASMPPRRFDLLAGDMHEATCIECHMSAQHKMDCGRRGLPIDGSRAWSDADEPQPARDFAWADEECPETERNTEHE